MSASASGRKTPVDYGVQIRFINDLHDTGGGGGGGGGRRDGSGKSSSRYGVAVRVQGIAGQPYVMLKDGKKGDSYGVQLRTPSYSSLPRYTSTFRTAAFSCLFDFFSFCTLDVSFTRMALRLGMYVQKPDKSLHLRFSSSSNP